MKSISRASSLSQTSAWACAASVSAAARHRMARSSSNDVSGCCRHASSPAAGAESAAAALRLDPTATGASAASAGATAGAGAGAAAAGSAGKGLRPRGSEGRRASGAPSRRCRRGGKGGENNGPVSVRSANQERGSGRSNAGSEGHPGGDRTHQEGSHVHRRLLGLVSRLILGEDHRQMTHMRSRGKSEWQLCESSMVRGRASAHGRPRAARSEAAEFTAPQTRRSPTLPPAAPPARGRPPPRRAARRGARRPRRWPPGCSPSSGTSPSPGCSTVKWNDDFNNPTRETKDGVR